MQIIIQQKPFDPIHEQGRFTANLDNKRIGAVLSFTGTMRDMNEDVDVTSMFLEHYPGMTEKQISRVCHQAQEKWQLIDILVIHRIGHLLPGEPIVLICVCSEHRSDAFNACRYLINELKSTAPFWKSENTAKGEKWVEENTKDNKI